MNKFVAMYRALMVIYITYYRSKNIFTPYSTISWSVIIMITCLLPILLPMAIIKSSARFITNKDADEALKEAGRTMTVYQQTSEFEYRSPPTVFRRIVENTPTHRTSDGYIVLLSTIAADFVSLEGRLYKIRPETKEEFLKRRLNEEMYDRESATADAVLATLNQQFDLIVERSDNNILKCYYLGLEIMAQKIVTGNKKSQQPPKTVHEVPQT